MNIAQKKIIRQYITSDKSFFPAFYPKKRKITSELKRSLNCYCIERNNFTTEELYDEFGSPQEYVSAIISNTPNDELLNNIRMKKRTVFIIGLILVFVFAVGITSTTLIVRIASNLATSHFYEIEEVECYTIPAKPLSAINNK